MHQLTPFYSSTSNFQVKPTTNRTKCLGKGKGRPYPPMKPETKTYLKKHFRLDNEALLKLLTRLGYPIPDWLEDDLKDPFEEENSGHNPEEKKTKSNEDEDVAN